MLNEFDFLRRVAVRHPRDLFRDQSYIAEHWRAHDFEGEPDYRRAAAEYETFLEHLRDAGAEVAMAPMETAYSMASIYARDSSVLTPDGIVPARMGNAYRAAEPELDAGLYGEAGDRVHAGIAAPGTLEGGDVVWFHDHLCAVGEGYRTNAEGIRQFRDRVGSGVTVKVVQTPHYRGPGFCLHLMSVLSPVDADLAAVYSPLMPVAFRRWLQEEMGMRLVEVPDDEFDRQGANVLAVAPRKVLIHEGAPETARRLEAEGCEVITFPGHDICVLGVGGPTCLTRPLERG